MRSRSSLSGLARLRRKWHDQSRVHRLDLSLDLTLTCVWEAVDPVACIQGKSTFHRSDVMTLAIVIPDDNLDLCRPVSVGATPQKHSCSRHRSCCALRQSSPSGQRTSSYPRNRSTNDHDYGQYSLNQRKDLRENSRSCCRFLVHNE